MPESYEDDEQLEITPAEVSDSVAEVIVAHNSDKPDSVQLREDGATGKKLVAAALRDPFLGTAINERYQVLSLIGKGATSAVYKAQDLTTKELVAMKILHSHLVGITTIVARFEQEAKTSRLLQHPNIVAVREVDIAESGNPFLVMDLVEGTSLQDTIRTAGWLPTQQAIPIFLQVCAALAVAHEKGVVHRDLKPSNIMLTELQDGTFFVKVLDFGIAKLLTGQGDTVMKLTQTGETLGSLLYMSPEQCLDQDLDGRSDCYSLGCVMYETMTGKPPLCARTAFETMNKHMTESPERLDRVRPDIEWPRGLQEVVFKALAKAPAQRYQNVGHLQDDLQALLSGSARLPEGLISHSTRSETVAARRLLNSHVSQNEIGARTELFKQLNESRGNAGQALSNSALAEEYRKYSLGLTRKSILFTAPIFLAILGTLFYASIEDWALLLPVAIGLYAFALAVFLMIKKKLWVNELPFRPTTDCPPESAAIAGWWGGQFEYSNPTGQVVRGPNTWSQFEYPKLIGPIGRQSDMTFTAFFSYSNGAISGRIADSFGNSEVIGMVDYPIVRFKKIYEQTRAKFLYEGTFSVDGSISGTWRQAGFDSWTGTWTIRPIARTKSIESFTE